MTKIQIDFTNIGSEEDFYNSLKEKINIPEHFGNNLDALWDIITAHLEMPLEIEFFDMSVEQLETFENLIQTLEEADEEIEDFDFRYYLEQFE